MMSVENRFIRSINNMLRQRVLESWKKYKQKLTKLNKDIELLGEQVFIETALPSFPNVLDSMRRSLDS